MSEKKENPSQEPAGVEWGFYARKDNVENKYKHTKSLSQLALTHQTDKGGGDRELYGWGQLGNSVSYPNNHPLDYVSVYEEIMQDYREEKINLLEIGISDERCPLASVKMWLEYFKKVNIYTWDINCDVVSAATSMGANHIHGDQGDRAFWLKILPHIKDVKFDFIIEDGSHRPWDMLISFIMSVDLLKPNGYYFMEDIQDPLSTAGTMGYENTSIYNMVQEFRDTGQLFSRQFPELNGDLKYLEEQLEFIKMHRGGPKNFRTLMATFRKKQPYMVKNGSI